VADGLQGHVALHAGRLHPLTVLDDHSRFAVVLAACANEQTETVRQQLIIAFDADRLFASQHAALQRVSNAQFDAQLLQIDLLVLEGECSAGGDDDCAA
jgi:hypothetical protein